jgi:adenylate cyclase
MARTGNPGQNELRQVPRRRRAWWGGLAGLVIGVAVYGLGFLPHPDLLGFEHRTIDWRQRYLARPTPASRQVAVVLIDEHSIQEMRRREGVTWVWPRDVYVPIIIYLKEAGARAIVFDMLFTDPWPQRKLDQDLADAVREAGNVVLAAKLDEALPGLSPLDDGKAEAERAGAAAALAKARLELPGWTFARPPGFRPDHLRPPIPELTAAARGIGFANVFSDRDIILRRADLVEPSPDGTALLASLPLAAAVAALGDAGRPRLAGRELLVGDSRIPLPGGGRPLVRYYGPDGTIQSENAFSVIASFTALAEGKPPPVPPEVFRDRIVIIGTNAAGLEDIVPAPTSTRFPGAEFQATVCANILGGEFLRELGETGRLLLFLAIGILGGVSAFLAWQPLAAAASSVLLFSAHAGFAVWLFRSGTVLSVLELFFPFLILGGTFLAATVTGYLLEGRGKREVAKAFGQYLSPAVIQELMKDPAALRLGGETREITVYFSDIKGFSTFSEGMSSDVLVPFLNIYLTAMTDVLLDHEALVDKYIGDAVLAFWGAPQAVENGALAACLATIEHRRLLPELNRRFAAAGLPQIEFRVGLHRGTATVGNMGSSRRFNYTAMGPTVNLASRLEGANKSFGSHVLMTREVRDGAGAAVVARRLGRVQVVGIRRPVEVFELLGRAGDLAGAELERLERYHVALARLEEGATAEALEAFESLHREKPDAVLEKTVERARKLCEAGAPWDGVWVLAEKG